MKRKISQITLKKIIFRKFQTNSPKNRCWCQIENCIHSALNRVVLFVLC